MWDKYQACKMLSIPYRVYDMPKEIGGYSNLMDRYIHINPNQAEDDRVWAHEIAHTLLHFQQVDSAAGQNRTLNALAEIEADTVAYIVTCTLGLENKDYVRYIRKFMRNVPVRLIYGIILDEAKWSKLEQTAHTILKAGGYYEQQ